MKLNLPILEQLESCQNILIAGAGGGFDIFCGLPLYFTLRQQGKTVHLANYSFMDLPIAKLISEPQVLIDDLLLGARGDVMKDFPYYAEGYLSQWFQLTLGEEIPMWMFGRVGVVPLARAYQELITHLGGIDAIVLVDGGVDSVMRGDEMGAGTLVEDSISLAAVDTLTVPVKILACIGFGTEIEEALCHYTALENMAALVKSGGFLGSCALTPQMEVFRLYEAACRYVFEQPKHGKSHISTRIIPAVHGEFGDFHMYKDENATSGLFVSPLMSLYWFFDANIVVQHSIIIDWLRSTYTTREAFARLFAGREQLGALRPRRSIPYP